jgi:hypothetical protein
MRKKCHVLFEWPLKAILDVTEKHLRWIHVIVNDWIDHGVGHGEPVEGKEDVLKKNK